MSRKRVALTVIVDLDPVGGFGHTAGSWEQWLESQLLSMAGHYNPIVVANEGEEA